MPDAIEAACVRLHRAVGQFGDDRHRSLRGIAACRPMTPPNLEEIVRLQGGRLAGPDHDQAVDLQPAGARISSAAPLLPLNWLAAAARLTVSAAVPRPCVAAPNFSAVVAKHHQNALGRGGKRDEADLDGVGHGKSSRNQG